LRNPGLVSIPLATPAQRETWKEIVPASDNVLSTVLVTGGRIVLLDLVDTYSRLRVYGKEGTFEGEIPLPGRGMVNSFGSYYSIFNMLDPMARAGEGQIVFAYSSPSQSPSLYRGDVAARNKLLLEIDELTKKANAAAPGSPEHVDLVKQITSKQMEANALTVEAYVGPGAGRMTVSGIKVVGHEAYQAAMSNLEMIQHILHESAGDVVVASREYEIYKYINRFAEAAEGGGAVMEIDVALHRGAVGVRGRLDEAERRSLFFLLPRHAGDQIPLRSQRVL
jgi:hypothetical protein